MPQSTEFWLLSLKGSVNFFNIWSCIWDFHQHRIERNRENELYKPQISLGFLLARTVQPIPRICSHWAIKSMRGQQQVKDFAAGRTLKIAKPPFPLACSRRFVPCRVPCREETPTCIHLEWIPPCTLGWSEKHKSWKIQKYQADSKLRHRTDFRTIFGIMIGWFVSCEIGQT